VLALVIFSDGQSDNAEPKSSSQVSELPPGVLEEGGSGSRVDEYKQIITKYGKPERSDSTEYDRPRPVIPTRIIEFRPQRVKIAFVPLGKLGDAPPYAGWKVIGYLDTSTNTKISPEEAEARLRDRLRPAR
jgi:hypothetical protein